MVNGTISDKRTGLVWQQSTVDYNNDGRVNQSDKIKWQVALNYCENFSLPGLSDWRLPNIRELLSVVDFTRYYPSINPIFDSRVGGHWSSTSCVGNIPGMGTTREAWIVFFVSGNDYWGGKANDLNYVRCVRGGFGGGGGIGTIIDYLLLMSEE